MNCLIIHGGPAKGFTWKAASYCIDAMKKRTNVSVEEVSLLDADIPFCRGCYACFERGEENCPHAERVQPIMRKIKQADCLIITSPVFAMNIPALLKNYFDHTAYNFHRPAMFDKRAIVVTSTAGGGAKTTACYIRDTLGHWGVNRVYTLPITRMGKNELSDAQKRRCEKIAGAFVKEFESKSLRAPTWKRVMFYNAWRAMNTAHSALPADRAYWRQNEMDTRAYRAGVPLGAAKRAAGGAVFWLMGRMLRRQVAVK